MATMTVKNAVGGDETVEKPLAPGTAADSASRPVAWSTEGKAQIGALTETAPASDTASSGLNGRLQRIAQRITSLIALVPASLGSKADSASFAVTKSTEDKALTGALTETAPASDTASSGLNGRLQRIAQRLTSMIALLPTALGAGGGFKVQVYDTTGTARDPQAVGPVAKAAAIHIDLATDSALAGLLAGLTPHKSLDLNETEEEVKATAGIVYALIVTNRRTTPVFIKFYNATAANVTVGTTTPVMTIEIPANASDHTLAINAFTMWGVAFGTAICVAATTGFADNDTGAPAANDVIATVLYK